MLPVIAERRAEIAEICRRFGVRRLTLFGSGARLVDFEPERSDVDFLVAFEAAASPALGEFFAPDALAAAVGRPVDLVVEGSVRNPFIRAGIERSAETVYGPRSMRLSLGRKEQRRRTYDTVEQLSPTAGRNFRQARHRRELCVASSAACTLSLDRRRLFVLNA